MPAPRQVLYSVKTALTCTGSVRSLNLEPRKRVAERLIASDRSVRQLVFLKAIVQLLNLSVPLDSDSLTLQFRFKLSGIPTVERPAIERKF